MISLEPKNRLRNTESAAQDAVELFLRPLLQPAYRLAYMLLRDREAAEDAVQEAALKSWRKFSKLKPDAEPRPWFFGFVVNECRNMRRARWRSVIRLGLPEQLGHSPLSNGSDPDLREALASLSMRDRTVVLLHFYFGMSIEEIGVATATRPAAVRRLRGCEGLLLAGPASGQTRAASWL